MTENCKGVTMKQLLALIQVKKLIALVLTKEAQND